MLSPSEMETLRLIALGLSASTIRRKLGLNPSTYHTRCYNIRRKTGISSTRDALECHLWLHQQNPRKQRAPHRNGPTRSQLAALQLVAAGLGYAQIAQTLSITPQTAQNVISQGCKRAGIPETREKRVLALKRYLRALENPEPADPMDDPMF